MATWNSDAIIDLIFTLFYAILLVLNIFNVFRHGFTKEAGYIFLVIVSLFKIVGNILSLVVETGSSHSITVAIWGLIISQLGFYPLLNAGLAFMRKWIRIWQSADPELVRYLGLIRLVNLPLLAAFVCAIISGIWTNPTSNNIDEGYQLRRAADILFLVSVLCILALASLLLSKSRTIEQRMDLVLVQVLLVSPFLLIRITYAVVQAFISTPTNPGRNTWVYLGLLLIPDFISVAIYTVCGFKVKKMPPAAEWQLGKDNEIGRHSGQFGTTDVEGNVQAEQPARMRRQGRRRPRGPIGMLISAILDASHRT